MKSSKNKKVAVSKSVRKSSHELWASKDFLSMKEVQGADLEALFKLTDKMKKSPEQFYSKLKGKALAIV